MTTSNRTYNACKTTCAYRDQMKHERKTNMIYKALDRKLKEVFTLDFGKQRELVDIPREI
jgi:hypothetical protein